MDEMTKIEVLVVDDEEVMRKLMTKILEKAGYTVHTAAGGLEARALLAEHEFDMVLSDVKMPDMNGFELPKEIMFSALHFDWSHPVLRRTRVVVRVMGG